MAVNTIENTGSLPTTADNSRGPSYNIWADCPVANLLEDPSIGMYYFDDFINSGAMGASTAAVKGNFGNWLCYGDIGATIVDGALEGGVIVMGSDGDNEGVTLSSSSGAFRLVTTSTLALNQKLWFEARVNRSSIAATKGDFFVGLADSQLSTALPAANTIISATDNTLSTTPNVLGFMSKGNAPTEWGAVYQLAAGTAVYPTGLTTLMNTVTGAVLSAGTQYVKLGMKFDPNAQVKTIVTASTGQTLGALKKALITFYVNGIPAPAFLTSDNLGGAAFPTGFMSLCMAVCNQTGASPPTMGIDWIRCAQLANS